MPNTILDSSEIENKIRRIAYQIYETHVNYDNVILAGIAENGFVLAEKIGQILAKISPLKVHYCRVSIDKKNPLNPVTTSIPAAEYQDQALVLVDDVLHTGTTLIYAVKHFLEVPLAQFKTAVLVNRNHKKYPVKADFKGISLSTSLNENVEVIFEGAAAKVTLS